MRFVDGHSDRFPRLVRFLALHAMFGACLGTIAAGALILANVGGLYDLMAASSALALGSAMLMVSFALTFASAAMGTAVMMLPRDGSSR